MKIECLAEHQKAVDGKTVVFMAKELSRVQE
jgi:hypothetical protein